MKIFSFAFIFAVLFSAESGCSPITPKPTSATFIIQTNSSSCWNGFFDNATIEGCGSKIIEVNSSEGIFTGSVVKKNTSGVPLALKLKIDDEVVKEGTTTVLLGVVAISNAKD